MEIEYEQIIGSAETKWLSLEPTVNTIIKKCSGLGSYFMSHERCPTILKKTCFYVSYLLFLQSHLHTFSTNIKDTESKYVSASEVTEKLDLLAERIKILNKDTFLALKI